MRTMLAKTAIAVITAVLLVLLVASTGNCSGLLLGTGGSGSAVGLDGPFYTQLPSRSSATGGPQVKAEYCGSTWMWDCAEGSYLGTFVTGIGLNATVYPVIKTEGLEALAVGVYQGDPLGNYSWKHDKKSKTWSFTTPGITTLSRNEIGKYQLPIPLGPEVGTGLHCLQFVALVRDANRKVTTIRPLIILPWPEINFVGKAPAANLVTTLRFKTEAWPAGCEKPSGDYLISLMRRAGVGGNGDVYKSLIANDQARAAFRAEEDSRPRNSEKSVTKGTYYLQVTRGGRAYNGQVWVKPSWMPGQVLTLSGLITAKNAVLSESCDGIVKDFSYTVEYSCDGQNWLSKTYTPTVGCTEKLPL